MGNKLLIAGASNPEDLAVARRAGFRVVGFLDDNSRHLPTFQGLSVCAFHGNLSGEPRSVMNSICGFTEYRKNVFDRLRELGYTVVNVIDSSAQIAALALARKPTGLYIQGAVIVQAGCTLESNASIHMGSLIGHETFIGAHSVIAHGVNVSGRVTIGEGAYIGAGATILPNVSIGDWSTVGAGSVVTKDVPAGAVVKGVPAK